MSFRGRSDGGGASGGKGASYTASSHALFQSIPLPLEEEEGEDEISNEDKDQTDDDCTRCGLSYTLGTSSGSETPAATHLQRLPAS